MKNVKCIILGADGTLGQALQRILAGVPVVTLSSGDIDVTIQESVDSVLRPLMQDHTPHILINATAINAVDKIETDEATKKLAFAVNGEAVGNLARLAKEHGARFVHYSTDYVFDGTAHTPYVESAEPNPQSEYARSKRLGEVAALTAFPESLVIRTSRLFGSAGKSSMSKKSFVDIVKQAAAIGEPKQFVDEEVAGPTWVDDLAVFTRSLLEQDQPGGIYHGTNAGSCTWFGFAQEILKQIGSSLPITPVPASTFPRPAKRPAYSVLLSTKIPQLRSWQEALTAYLV